MTRLLANLAKLQEIELASKAGVKGDTTRTELRAAIPEQILEHYDRLMACGKKGIVPVRNQNCAGCHMRVPLGTVMTLQHANDIQLCDNCGRYLYLPVPEEADLAKPTAKPKKTERGARKPRKTP